MASKPETPLYTRVAELGGRILLSTLAGMLPSGAVLIILGSEKFRSSGDLALMVIGFATLWAIYASNSFIPERGQNLRDRLKAFREYAYGGAVERFKGLCIGTVFGLFGVLSGLVGLAGVAFVILGIGGLLWFGVKQLI